MEELRPQTIRRPLVLKWLIIIASCGALFLTVSIAARASATDPVVALINLPVALALGWFAWAMFTAKASELTFDGTHLTDNAGVVVCELDQIDRVERGFALFKPSGGFALFLKTDAARGWSPGLWWRTGRRVGVGGATFGRAARNMADSITMALALRDMPEDAKKAMKNPKRDRKSKTDPKRAKR